MSAASRRKRKEGKNQEENERTHRGEKRLRRLKRITVEEEEEEKESKAPILIDLRSGDESTSERYGAATIPTTTVTTSATTADSSSSSSSADTAAASSVTSSTTCVAAVAVAENVVATTQREEKDASGVRTLSNAPVVTEEEEEEEKFDPNDEKWMVGQVYKFTYLRDTEKGSGEEEEGREEEAEGWVQLVGLQGSRDGTFAAIWLYQSNELAVVWAKRTSRPIAYVQRWLADVAGLAPHDLGYSNHQLSVDPSQLSLPVDRDKLAIRFTVDIWGGRLTRIESPYTNELLRLSHPRLFLQNRHTLNFEDSDEEEEEEKKEEKEEGKEWKGLKEGKKGKDKESKEIKSQVELSWGGCRELSSELREFRDSLCADDSMYFETSEGLRVLAVLRSTLTFGHARQNVQAVRGLVWKFYLGSLTRPHITGRVAEVKEMDREKGRCGLCDCTPRTLTARIGFSGLDDNFYRIGSECREKLVLAQNLLVAIWKARRWFASLSRPIYLSTHTQLVYHHTTITRLSYIKSLR